MRVEGTSHNTINLYAGRKQNLEEQEQRKSINGNDLSLNDEDGIMSGLLKQIQNTKDQMRELADDKDMTPEQKRDKQKELNEEIANLNSQLLQRQMDLKEQDKVQQQEKLEEQLEGTSSKVEQESETGIDTKKMIALTEASVSMEQVSTLNRLKVKMQGEIDVTKIEIELDGQRGNSSSLKVKSVNNKEAKLNNIDKKVGDVLGNINSPANEEEKAEEIKDEKIEERVEEQKEKQKEKQKEQYAPIDLFL